MNEHDKGRLRRLGEIACSLLSSYEASRLADERETELSVTLEHMDQAVTVFDADAKLVLWNQRYLEMFEKPENVVRKGVSLEELIATQNLADGFEGFEGGYQEMLAELKTGLAKGEIVPGGVRLDSGRMISSIHAPMPNGGWVATHTDITERVQAQEMIEYASLHDNLTGLANRLKFHREYEAAAKATDCSIAIMLVDIDHFKEVNDHFGHGAGDAVIVDVAERLKRCVRDTDLVARLGGRRVCSTAQNVPSAQQGRCGIHRARNHRADGKRTSSRG